MTAERTIKLHALAPAPGSRHPGKRLGCGTGSGHGQTSTRGQKGQRSRSGDGKLVGFEGGQTPLVRRIPKRGFTNRFREPYQIVHLTDLERIFTNQKEVSIDALRMHGLIQGRAPIKILGDGELRHALKVQAHSFSKNAAEKITKAGGTAEVLTR